MAGYLDQLNFGGLFGGGTALPSVAGTVAAPAAVSPSTAYAAQAGAPAVAGADGAGAVPQLNGWQNFGYAMQGLSALGGLWGGIQQNKIAKEQLALSREAYNTNMNNTIQSYNTSLEDRIRARYAMEGKSSADAETYLNENRLTRS